MKMYLHAPPPALAGYVSSIVMLEHDAAGDTFFLPLIAKGYPSLVFQSGPSLLNSKREHAAELVLYGQNIAPIKLYAAEHFTVVAFFFYPAVLKRLFGFHASELADTCIDLSLLPLARRTAVRAQLLDADINTNRVHVLSSFIVQLIHESKGERNEAVAFAAHLIRSSMGQLSLKGLLAELHTTERTLQRHFEMHVGLSPKLFSKVCRFDAAFQHINNGTLHSLTQIAHRYGYADQSHFIREFREFTHFSPTEYLQSRPPLIE